MTRSDVDSGANPDGQRRAIVSATWQGPIPPPTLLADYNGIIPNGAERIMRMAEKAQDAEIEMGRQWYKANARGQRLGSAISITALVLSAASGAFALYMGAPGLFYALPAALVSVPVFSVVRSIVEGYRKDGGSLDDLSE